uniref:Uncharacterized protein n=1 Tax=Oryza meridionalis TaxID=40149 RepID=A0A0E0C056_9ORYZ
MRPHAGALRRPRVQITSNVASGSRARVHWFLVVTSGPGGPAEPREENGFKFAARNLLVPKLKMAIAKCYIDTTKCPDSGIV